MLAALLALAVLDAAPALAQSHGPPWRIGWLSGGSPDNAIARDTAASILSKALADLGYEQGRNVTIEYRYGAGRVERYPELAAELVAWRADVIVAVGASETLAARAVTTTVPIVFAYVPDPVGLGIAASLAHPGGNATGLSSIGIDLAGKRLELLLETVPAVRRVTEILTPGLGTGDEKLAATREAARLRGIEVRGAELRDAADIERFFTSLDVTPDDALVVQHNAVTSANRGRIAGLASSRRVPAIYEDRLFVASGGLMSYGVDFAASTKRAATYVARILKGASPAELPIEQPASVEFVVNLAVAHAIGLEPPAAMLSRADEVIE